MCSFIEQWGDSFIPMHLQYLQTINISNTFHYYRILQYVLWRSLLKISMSPWIELQWGLRVIRHVVHFQPTPDHAAVQPGRSSSPFLLFLLLAFPRFAFLFLARCLQWLLFVRLHLVGFLSQVSALIVRPKSDRVVLGVGSRLGVGGNLRGSSDFSCVDFCDQVVKEESSP